MGLICRDDLRMVLQKSSQFKFILVESGAGEFLAKVVCRGVVMVPIALGLGSSRPNMTDLPGTI